jgi:hypothetical protein
LQYYAQRVYALSGARRRKAFSMTDRKKPKQRDIFQEIMEGIKAMKLHRERKITLTKLEGL